MWLIRVIIVVGILWCIAAIVGWLLRAALFNKIRKMQAHVSRPGRVEEKALVQCQYCKAFIDKDKAIEYKGMQYCNQKHLEQAQKEE